MKNQRGSALLVVVIAFAVLMILGTAIMVTSMSETRQVVHQEERVAMHYAARSGAEAMASYLIQTPSAVSTVIAKTASQPATGSIDGKEFEVRVTGTTTAPVIASRVYETINGIKTEIDSVRLSLQATTTNFVGFSVFANNVLSTGQNNTINGDIGTNSATVNIGNNADVNGTIVTSANVTIPTIDETRFTTDLNWSNGSGNAISNSGINYYRVTHSLTHNREYYFNGSGELHILVTNATSFNSAGGIFNNGGTAKLYFYYNGTGTINFSGHADSGIAIYAPNATVNFNGGANETYTGAIVCNNYSGPNSNCTLDPDPGLNMDNMAVNPAPAGFVRNVYGK